MKHDIFTFVWNFMWTCVWNWKDTNIQIYFLKGHEDSKRHWEK